MQHFFPTLLVCVSAWRDMDVLVLALGANARYFELLCLCFVPNVCVCVYITRKQWKNVCNLSYFAADMQWLLWDNNFRVCIFLWKMFSCIANMQNGNMNFALTTVCEKLAIYGDFFLTTICIPIASNKTNFVAFQTQSPHTHACI